MKLDLVSNLKYWLLTINNTHNFVLPVMYGGATYTAPNRCCRLLYYTVLQSLVVHSIDSLTSSLRDQLVKCFTTL